VEFRRAADERELQQARELRERVFTGEQGVELESHNPDGLDDALQIVAVEEGEIIGTCRVLMREDAAWLGRLAVEPHARRRGIGQGVLAAAEAAARDSGLELMRLHSQDYIEPMYLTAGYVRCDEPFVEQGVPHVSMEKRLA
jgi:predicted GNAT family N-acyltransferase